MTELWKQINISEWRNTPCISKRAAKENDVKAGNAVFYIPTGSVAHELPLPHCAIQLHENGRREPVIIIQAESIGSNTTLGVRYISGGNGICAINEVELLNEPNHEFGI